VAEVAVKDGQDVKVGDLLFKLDDRALQAQLDKDTANLAKDQAAQTSAQLELTRDKDLLDKGVGTQQTYDQQGATAQEAVATVAADQAAIEVDKVQLSFATITAPIAGRLGEVNVSPGDSVAPATGASQSGGTAAPSALVTITQMDPLQVTFSLPETDLPLLQSGLANPTPPVVTLRLPGGTDPVATGTLDFINSSIDTTTGTIAARASIDNSAGKLWPGQYVEVSVQLGTLPGAVVVPTVAIQASQKGPFVYVAGADSKASIRQVTPSAAVDDTTALSDGLKAGENVVVEGQGRLQDGAAIREQQPGGGTGSATLKAAGTSK
jgi:multidrug efflux system membrane fusion protein